MSTPTSDRELRQEVLCLYGELMFQVQSWERALGLVWWRRSLKGDMAREAESKATVKAIGRLEHAFTKMTATEASRELRGGLPDALVDEIAGLIPERNRLARRVIVERQDGDGFAAGTLRLLAEAGLRFEQSMHHLLNELQAMGTYRGPVRDHWPALAEEVAERVFAGEPVDYDELLRRANSEPDDS